MVIGVNNLPVILSREETVGRLRVTVVEEHVVNRGVLETARVAEIRIN